MMALTVDCSKVFSYLAAEEDYSFGSLIQFIDDLSDAMFNDSLILSHKSRVLLVTKAQ